MKTKNNKKVLAWVLSICMAIALLPAMPVEYAQAAEVTQFNYKFYGLYTDVARNGSENISYYVGTNKKTLTVDYVNLLMPSETVIPTLAESSSTKYNSYKGAATLTDFAKGINYETGNKNLEITGGSAFEFREWLDEYAVDKEDVWSGTPTSVKLAKQNGGTQDYGLYFKVTNTTTSDRTTSIDVKIKVTEEGYYTLFPRYMPISIATDHDARLAFKVSDANAEEKFSRTLSLSSSASWNEVNSIGTSYFKQGDYNVNITFLDKKSSSEAANGASYAFVSNLYLKKMAIAPSTTSAELVEGGSTDISLTLNQAGAAYSGDVTYSAVSANGTTATASVSGSTLTVTGGSAGSTTVTVTATVDGTTAATLDIPVTVTTPTHPTFGTSYAYIREDFDGEKTTYKLILIAGINSLNYSKVGFNYTIDGKSAETTEETSAYKTLTLGEKSLTAADLGVGEDGYLFYSEIDIDAADAENGIIFNAYAEGESDPVPGGDLEITSVVNKQ